MEGTAMGSAGEDMSPMCPACATLRKQTGMSYNEKTYLYRQVILQSSITNTVIAAPYRKRTCFHRYVSLLTTQEICEIVIK